VRPCHCSSNIHRRLSYRPVGPRSWIDTRNLRTSIPANAQSSTSERVIQTSRIDLVGRAQSCPIRRPDSHQLPKLAPPSRQVFSA